MNDIKNIPTRKTKDFLFISIISLLTFFLNRPFANLEQLTPDACLYLDIGRNFLQGKGALISFNVYQFWPERYHPALPFIHPVYPFIAGVIWFFFDIKAVIIFNILLLTMNLILLYKIISLHYNQLISFLIAIFMSFSKYLIHTSMFPWTEQLHLFFLLSSVFIYIKFVKNPLAHFCIGILLAFSCLVRVASIYNVLAFGIVIVILRGFSHGAIQEYFKISMGFFMIFLPHELFCYWRYKALYPEYLKAAITYSYAVRFEGAFYTKDIPVLNWLPGQINWKVQVINILNHFKSFYETFKNIQFTFILAPFYALLNLSNRKRHFLIIFCLQGFGVILGYILSLPLLPEIEAHRYTTIPYMTIGSVGLLSIYGFFHRLFYGMNRRIVVLVSVILLYLFIFLQIRESYPFISYYRFIYPRVYNNEVKKLDRIFEWVRTNTLRDDLIACDSVLLFGAFLLDRPIVSLPSGKVLTQKNIKDFLSIFSPKYILICDEDLIKLLEGFEFSKIISVGNVVFLKNLKIIR